MRLNNFRFRDVGSHDPQGLQGCTREMLCRFSRVRRLSEQLRPRIATQRTAVAGLLLAFAWAGCGGKPFNVKPAPNLPPGTDGVAADTSVARIKAEAVRDEDYVYDTFDANLIMAGVLPVKVMITNSGGESLDLQKARFEVRSAAGRKYRSIDSGRAYKRLISYYGVSVYSVSGYKEAREDFASHGLDIKTPLEPGGVRHGMVFFPVPPEVTRMEALTLSIRQLGSRKSKEDSNVDLPLT